MVSGFRAANALGLGPYVLAAFVLGCSLLHAEPASTQILDTTLWVPNNRVEAILRKGSTIYVGGRFTEVGPPTGSGVAIQYPSGSVVSGFPKVNGIVYAVASDSAGGWFIGGAFTAVNGAARLNAAHIRSDLVISEWNPNVGGMSNARVNSIVVHGGKVYLGGFFTSAGGRGAPGEGIYFVRVTGEDFEASRRIVRVH